MSDALDCLFDDSPLNDPAYQPKEAPTPSGGAPEVIAKWGPRSQMRWFRRYRPQLKPHPHAYWARFNCSSLEHLGLCCESCMSDQEDGYDYIDEHCCCKAEEIQSR